jgi:hypothetical protein
LQAVVAVVATHLAVLLAVQVVVVLVDTDKVLTEQRTQLHQQVQVVVVAVTLALLLNI